MRTILVTGSCGQLGRELRIASGKSEDRYIFTDIIKAEGLDTVHLDMTDVAAVNEIVDREGVDVIVNCAAFTNVDAAEDYPGLAATLNTDAVAGLASVASRSGALLVHVSTDYVFGGQEFNNPITEDTPASPLGVYGRTKLAGEQAIINSGCRYVIIRTAWLYSEFCKNFMKTMLSLFDSRPSVTVVSDQFGTPTYALDLAEAIIRVIESPVEGLYHFTDEGRCSWYDFASEIAAISGTACKVVPCTTAEYPTKAMRPAYSVLDKTRIKSTYGISIPSWQDSLRVCYDNFIKSSDK